jgi:hypothetical protein
MLATIAALAVVIVLTVSAVVHHIDDQSGTAGCIHTGDLGRMSDAMNRNYNDVCVDQKDHGLVRIRYTEPDSQGAFANAELVAVAAWRLLDTKPTAIRVQDNAFSDGNTDRTFSSAYLKTRLP